ncbi:flagellar hook-length control protein [Rhodoferax ferrireducens T118]|uniref:Flagellar hook-length control protein n=1 Tax=Albidiferax ferrireducens (strain ATCC BAA-621 / DSM 15236 / T118) TaxID=338969 RepID=Q221J7_ALBFT|nr:flagellar hook-length control protein FliK [Rhodoferax ferrireducens]ABD68306.1 flagellar hook-length control protein [Rhodoferax ferrireducens T118]
MSVESSSTASSPKILGAVESSSAKDKGKVKSGEKPDDVPGGFLALITALDSDTDVSAEVSVATTAPDADPALLLAQAGATGAVRAVGAGGATGTVGVGAVGAKAGVANEPLAQTTLPTSGRASSAASLLNLEPGNPKQAVDAMLEQAAQTSPAWSTKGKGAGFQSAVSATVADARAVQQAGRADSAASEPALSGTLLSGEGALLSSEIGDALLKPVQRSANKFSGLSANAGMEGAWGHQALLAGNRVNTSVALASPSMQSLGPAVADTVSYWVTQGVQNAELKLDGLGGESVEVKISLKGDQAHIGFRTDQPEIRQMLEGALAHLRDALKSEGLVLSGVSVGASGQDGSGAQEQRNPPGIRQAGQANLITTEQLPTPGQQRVNLTVGRALDLFV